MCRVLFLCTLLFALPLNAADDGKWVTIKGKIVWDTARGAAPKRMPLKATKDEDVAAKDDDFNSEEWIVDPKTGGLKNAIVWVVPEPSDANDVAALKKAIADDRAYAFKSFAVADIHPDLAKVDKKVIEIDQPCCRFIPHVLVARAGQEVLIKNSAPVAHNAKWTSSKNGDINPLIPAGKEFKLPAPLAAEPRAILIECSIHPWMRAHIRVFDHPYYALTDKDGNFEIKHVPVLKGRLRMFIWHEDGMHKGKVGRYGDTIEAKAGNLDMKEIKFDGAPKKAEK